MVVSNSFESSFNTLRRDVSSSFRLCGLLVQPVTKCTEPLQPVDWHMANSLQFVSLLSGCQFTHSYIITQCKQAHQVYSAHFSFHQFICRPDCLCLCLLRSSFHPLAHALIFKLFSLLPHFEIAFPAIKNSAHLLTHLLTNLLFLFVFPSLSFFQLSSHRCPLVVFFKTSRGASGGSRSKTESNLSSIFYSALPIANRIINCSLIYLLATSTANLSLSLHKLFS